MALTSKDAAKPIAGPGATGKPTPGLLFVTMKPKPTLPSEQFHEWYNNEHGPTRLRLPRIFTNGLRYATGKDHSPPYVAMYDVTDLEHLTTPVYTSLRENRSPREAETIAQVDVDRQFFELIHEYKVAGYRGPESLSENDVLRQRLAIDTIVVKNEEEIMAARNFCVSELVPWARGQAGWMRSRMFRSSSLDSEQPLSLVALHDMFHDGDGIDVDLQGMEGRPNFHDEILSRYMRLFYVFGPAPRDLAHLYQVPVTASFISADGKTQTVAGKDACITSYVTMPDGLEIPYRLEGNASSSAPTIAFSNSLLTSMHMWDSFIAILKKERPDMRFLRYDTRGRHATPSTPATLDMLVDDLSYLIRALRIPKLHTLMGVSMGGATTLKFAITCPDLLDRFIACDFNVASSPANTSAWKDRISTAEGEGIARLARMTVERWFHPDTITQNPDVTKWMIDMVAGNDVQGFKYSCQALWDYDIKANMAGCDVPGLFVVGDGDGKGALVKAMEGFTGLLGVGKAKLKIVPRAGHLPMVEQPERFWESVQEFLV